MSVPKVTINDLSDAIEAATNPSVKTVLEGILNDWMDLQYGKSTPYTTGKTVLPVSSTIEDVETAVNSDADQKFKDIFGKICDTYKTGDLSPQSVNDGSWDPKFTPVFVFVSGNP
ncbi:unnamed protein product [Pieris macdunnoughi]|uniref:Uncharacterized protein n=1 Tax=Pieris macdunnoughi TaxID=345717 RepID=A0A821VWB7_9NEOP|nr:unnamed protein product [Pieris macdunnoughi]